MALPTSEGEDIAIINVVKQRKLYFPWIGLVRRYDKVFHTVYGLQLECTNWGKGEPNDVAQNENCGQYRIKLGKMAWNDEPCSRKYDFICEDKRSRREYKYIL